MTGLQQSHSAEAEMENVPFGDIELQNHEPAGYSVHIEDTEGKYCGSTQMPH